MRDNNLGVLNEIISNLEKVSQNLGDKNILGSKVIIEAAVQTLERLRSPIQQFDESFYVLGLGDATGQAEYMGLDEEGVQLIKDNIRDVEKAVEWGLGEFASDSIKEGIEHILEENEYDRNEDGNWVKNKE